MTELDSAAGVTAFLARYGWRTTEPVAVQELSGGISCRVLRVATEDGEVVVKQALPELRVAGPWHADVARAEVEARFASVLAELVPGACPRVLATDPGAHAFVMTAAPAGSAPWKDALLAGHVEDDVAREVGRLLGLLHARAADRADLRTEFADRGNFRSLRLEPYLAVTAEAHPDLAGRIAEVGGYLDGPGTTLVHGDASPKNILTTPDGRALLIDHEVAHWGRPAFDTAFVVNHLCLKAIHRPARAGDYLRAVEALLEAYAEAAGDAGAAPAETALVLGPLMLARVDGRSPVEYLDAERRALVRQLARGAVADRPDLSELLRRVAGAAAAGGTAAGGVAAASAPARDRAQVRDLGPDRAQVRDRGPDRAAEGKDPA